MFTLPGYPTTIPTEDRGASCHLRCAFCAGWSEVQAVWHANRQQDPSIRTSKRNSSRPSTSTSPRTDPTSTFRPRSKISRRRFQPQQTNWRARAPPMERRRASPRCVRSPSRRLPRSSLPLPTRLPPRRRHRSSRSASRRKPVLCRRRICVRSSPRPIRRAPSSHPPTTTGNATSRLRRVVARPAAPTAGRLSPRSSG